MTAITADSAFAPASHAPALEDCAVIELRDYLLHPGRRDALVALFEREFVETQAAEGMRVIGTFTDLDRPDRFVWLRRFADMAARRRGLAAFYGGPNWQAHRSAANATMIDASDVRLLRYARPTWTLATPAWPRPRPVAPLVDAATCVHIDLCTLRKPVDAAWRRSFEREVLPLLVEHGAAPCAVLETEPAENDFPALPVRSGEFVFAWITRFADDAAAARATARLDASPAWTDRVLPRLLDASAAPMQLLRLRPTARSLLR